MAEWIQCQSYDEDRTPVWINLDHVAIIRPHDNGSVLVVALDHPSGGPTEIVVWDRPERIMKGLAIHA